MKKKQIIVAIILILALCAIAITIINSKKPFISNNTTQSTTEIEKSVTSQEKASNPSETQATVSTVSDLPIVTMEATEEEKTTEESKKETTEEAKVETQTSGGIELPFVPAN